jgi:copper resistance protein D
MDGSDHWIFFSLVVARAIQFVATILACGGMLFLLGILKPALDRSGAAPEASQKLTRRLSLLILAALVVLLLSTFCLLVLKSADMSGESLFDVVSGGILWTVITETAFGNAWAVRLVFLLLLMATWASPRMRFSRWFDAVRVALALSVAGVLAWTGHANAGSGLQRSGHLAVDVLHLIAASAWLGALLPLAFVLRESMRGALPFKAARIVVRRFSNLGVASVAALVASGIANTLLTIIEPRVLVEAAYGRILLLKVALFLIMLALAAFNRQRLTPGLADFSDEKTAARALRRNCLIEAALGVMILALVGALGILAPGGE